MTQRQRWETQRHCCEKGYKNLNSKKSKMVKMVIMVLFLMGTLCLTSVSIFVVCYLFLKEIIFFIYIILKSDYDMKNL